MKKLLLALVVLVGMGSTAMAQSKVAHVNTQTLLDTLESRKVAIAAYAKYEEEVYLELQTMDAEYKKAVDEYKADERTLTQVMKDIRIRKIGELEQRFQARQQSVQDELLAVSQELNQPILNMVQDAIKTVSETKKLSYVLDMTQALYHAGGTDITKEVLVELVKLDKAAMAAN